MSCNQKEAGHHVYDDTIYVSVIEEKTLETIYSGRVQLREDDVVIATYPKSGKVYGVLSVRENLPVRYNYIMMLMKFAYLGRSDRSNWIMWQVKDPCTRPGWDGCLTREK